MFVLTEQITCFDYTMLSLAHTHTAGYMHICICAESNGFPPSCSAACGGSRCRGWRPHLALKLHPDTLSLSVGIIDAARGWGGACRAASRTLDGLVIRTNYSGTRVAAAKNGFGSGVVAISSAPFAALLRQNVEAAAIICPVIHPASILTTVKYHILMIRLDSRSLKIPLYKCEKIDVLIPRKRSFRNTIWV